MNSIGWRKGFWRLTFALWVVGSAALLVLGGALQNPSLLRPLARIHPAGALEPKTPELPREVTLTPQEIRDLIGDFKNGFLTTEQLSTLPVTIQAQITGVAPILGGTFMKHALPEEVAAHSRWEAGLRPAFQTGMYWTAASWVGAGEVVWAILVWVVFYVLAWIGSGFRSQS